jgi:hypothetical protein
MIARTMEQPYRAPPAPRPVVEVSEVTAPLGAGRGVATVLLLVGVGLSLVPLASELTCAHGARGPTCDLVTWRGLYVERQEVDVGRLRGVEGAVRGLGLQDAVDRLHNSGDRSLLRLPYSGLYRDVSAHWHRDARLVDAAQVFFGQAHGDFRVRQAYTDAFAFVQMAHALALLAPLAALAAVVAAERRTRRLRVTVDPNLRVARARAAGWWGSSDDRVVAVGDAPQLRRADDAEVSSIPGVEVVSAGVDAAALLHAAAPEHGTTLDRLIERANRALAEGIRADRSPSALVRFAPSALLVVASAALLARVTTQGLALPPTTGTIVVTSTDVRCEMGEVSLLPGARLEWVAPAGDEVVRTFWLWPRSRETETMVHFYIEPGRVTRFDCARLQGAGPQFVGP